MGFYDFTFLAECIHRDRRVLHVADHHPVSLPHQLVRVRIPYATGASGDDESPGAHGERGASRRRASAQPERGAADQRGGAARHEGEEEGEREARGRHDQLRFQFNDVAAGWRNRCNRHEM